MNDIFDSNCSLRFWKFKIVNNSLEEFICCYCVGIILVNLLHYFFDIFVLNVLFRTELIDNFLSVYTFKLVVEEVNICITHVAHERNSFFEVKSACQEISILNIAIVIKVYFSDNSLCLLLRYIQSCNFFEALNKLFLP